MVRVTTFPDLAWHWDEYQLAYAIDDFDLARHQPHPPGYYGFVLGGRALAPFTGDPFDALRWISALALAAFVYLAHPRAARARAAWIAATAAFVLLSPLARRFGGAALPYAAEGVAWFAWLLAFQAAKSARAHPRLALAAGLAASLRPTLALWGGLLLAARLLRSGTMRAFAPAALAGALGVALWFVPLLVESGGLAAYREATGSLASGNVLAKSAFHVGAAAWFARLLEMAGDLSVGLGGMTVLVAAATVLRFSATRSAPARHDALALGAGLAFVFYALLIYDTPGYLMAVALPLVAWSLRVCADFADGLGERAAWSAGALAIAAVGLTSMLPGGRVAVDYEQHARILNTRFDAVRSEFEPRTTLLVTSLEYWDYGLRHVGHALPEFTTLQLARDPYFAITSDARPYLLARAGRVDAAGPEPLDLAALAPGGPLRHVVYVVPFDRDRFIAKRCEPLARALRTEAHETLAVLEIPPGWVLEASAGRLHCRGPS